MIERINVNKNIVLEEYQINEVLNACARKIVNQNNEVDKKMGISIFKKYFNPQDPIIDINKPIPGQGTWPPLAMATFLNKVDEVKSLLQLGANPAVEVDGNLNMLHIAATEGNATLCFYFLEKMYTQNISFINTQCKNGETALMKACQGGHFEAVKTLMKFKPNIMIQDNSKKSCLDHAIENDHYNIVKFINYCHLQDTVGANKENYKKKASKI